MGEPRDPRHVPEGGPDIAFGLDTDGDGRPDTTVTDDGVDLVVRTDLDGDRFADQVLRIGPDGAVREVAPPPAPGSLALDGLLGGVEAGFEG